MTDPTPTGTPAGSATCPICRNPFTATQPQHRYCCERCRKTAWRRRHPRSRAGQDPTGDAVPRPDTVPRPRDVPRDVPAVAAPPQTAPPTRCPHCAGPITVISLLIAPAAAHVTTPGSPHGH